MGEGVRRMTSASTKAVVDRHLEAWRRGDIQALLADYADDAKMLHAGMGVVDGKAAIGALLAQTFAELLPPADTALLVDAIVIGGDHALVHYTAVTSTVRLGGAFDAFTLRDGKIVAQFSGGEVIALD